MSDLGDTLYCADESDRCGGSFALVDGVVWCRFHQIMHEAMRLVCSETHDLFESEDEAADWIELSFDRDDPDGNALQAMDLPRICSHCMYLAEKDD